VLIATKFGQGCCHFACRRPHGHGFNVAHYFLSWQTRSRQNWCKARTQLVRIPQFVAATAARCGPP